MGHGVHGVVGTMDPHADGHVMTGYKNFITWVCFASCPLRGMLQERGWWWEDGHVTRTRVVVGGWACYKNKGGGGRMGCYKIERGGGGRGMGSG